MNFDKETVAALKSYIRCIKFAQEKAPNEQIKMLFACGCMGPSPECRCEKQNRLIEAFLNDPKEE
jgi:hypothetical protein